MSSVVATRLRYGSVLVAVVTGLFWADLHLWEGGPSALIVSVLALAAQAEFYMMARGDGRQPAVPLGLGMGAIWLAGVAFGFASAELLVGLVMALLLVFVLARRPDGASDRLGITLLGFLAVPFLLSELIALRALADGWAWLIFVVAVSKTGDSMAFFVGSAFGKHKLIPEVSPNKSWEGAFASVGGAILAGAIVSGTCFEVAPSWTLWLPAAMVANLGAQFGDLSESLLKRSFRTKDSAGILPAFGGTFDLVDSFLLAAPALHLYLVQFA
jgi:phosphatidate cytidylyltransferase